MDGKFYMTKHRRREDRKEKIRAIIPRIFIIIFIIAMTLLTLRECYP